MSTPVNARIAEAVRSQANWRWLKAEEYPEDARNARWAEAADRAADFIETLEPTDPRLQTIQAAQFDGPADVISLGMQGSRFASRCDLPPDQFLSHLAEIVADEAADEYLDAYGGELESDE